MRLPAIHLTLVLVPFLACNSGAGTNPAANPATAQPDGAPVQPAAAAPTQPSAGAGGDSRAADAGAPAQQSDAGATRTAAGSAGAPRAAAAGMSAEDGADAGEPTTAPSYPARCSGCPQDRPNPQDATVHLHHVHLNVADRERSAKFYQQFLNAKPVRLNGSVDALLVAPTLLLLDQQATAPPSGLPTALQHMGWGSADVPAWYTTAHAAGVAPDTRGNTLFNTNEMPTVGAPGSGAAIALLGNVPACFPVPDAVSYMYVLGPDQERIEIWSGADQRVNHLHFTTADLAATASWYQRFLGLPAAVPLLSYQFFLDDIVVFFEQVGERSAYKPTDDHVLGHFALSVSDLAVWRKRATDLDIEVVAEPTEVHGFESFFLRGPDAVLIEIVQASPAPELCPSTMK